MEDDDLSLMKLMLTEHAAEWSTASSTTSTTGCSSLVIAFKKHYGLSEAAKWKVEKDIWGASAEKG